MADSPEERFVQETIRPMAEILRSLRAKIDDARTELQKVNIPEDGTVFDARQDVQAITGVQIRTIIAGCGDILAILNGDSMKSAVGAACVRPLYVRPI